MTPTVLLIERMMNPQQERQIQKLVEWCKQAVASVGRQEEGIIKT
jgi:hypothetical protein